MSKFAQGKYFIKNPNKYLGKNAPTYRSSWEFTFMKFCDENCHIKSWASESVRIPYKNPITNKQTIYVPDFIIQYQDKNGNTRTELIEIKPSSQSLKEHLGKNKYNQAHYIVNQAKWTAAKQWCDQHNICFRIITEKDIFHSGSKK